MSLFRDVGPQKLIGTPQPIKRKFNLDKFNDKYLDGIENSLRRKIRKENLTFPIILFQYDIDRISKAQLEILLWIQKQLTNVFCIPWQYWGKNPKGLLVMSAYKWYGPKGIFIYSMGEV